MTETDAKAQGLVQLYHWSQQDEIISTPRGKITVREWIIREHERISSDPARRAEIIMRGTRVTLFVNRNHSLVRAWIYPK